MSAAQYSIAHILPWDSVGGSEHATLRIIKAVEGELFQNTIFCPQPHGALRDLFAAAGINPVAYRAVDPSYRHPMNFLRASFALAREFKRRKIDLVHCADLLAAYYAALGGKLAGLPVLSHIRCSYPNLSKRDQSFLWTVDKFAFVSYDTWRNFSYRVPAHKGTVVYDGIDALGEQEGSGAASGVREQFGIPSEAKIIGMVARVAPAKDYATLAKAAARIVKETRDVRFLIVGDNSNVENNRKHYEAVQQMLADHGVTPYFIFTGHREDVRWLISSMDIFVLSTLTEGLPLVILEAMAQGKPVVATNVGGIPEIVRDGETGLLHALQDDAQQAAQLLSLLRNRELRKRLGEAGRRLVKEHFTRERFAAEMIKLYCEMVGHIQQPAVNCLTERPHNQLGGY